VVEPYSAVTEMSMLRDDRGLVPWNISANLKRVAERCLFPKQYVAYGEISHFLCSVISQGKVVALDR